MGCFVGDGLTSRTVTLHFEVKAYARAEAADLEFGSSKYQKRLRGTKGDQCWIMKQFELLREHVRLMEETV